MHRVMVKLPNDPCLAIEQFGGTLDVWFLCRLRAVSKRCIQCVHFYSIAPVALRYVLQ